MEFKRWKFSEQVQAELENFLKIVEDRKTVNQITGNKLWEQLFTKLPRSFYNLKKSNDSNDDIIIIDSDDDNNVNKNELEVNLLTNNTTNLPDLSIIALTNHTSEQHLSVDLTNFKNSVKECLNNNRLLEKDDLKTISTILNNELVELFLFLNDNVSDNGLLKLGESLNNCSILNEQIIRQYCSVILLNKLIQADASILFTSVVNMFIKNYPNELKDMIFLPLMNNYLEKNYVFQQLYKLLPDTDKNNLIRDFLFSCDELEDGHFVLLQPIIPQISEFSLKQRFIILMSNCSDKFKNNKIYMKLLIEIIKTLNKDFLDQEPILYSIIEKNKTIFRVAAEKALNNWFNNCSSD